MSKRTSKKSEAAAWQEWLVKRSLRQKEVEEIVASFQHYVATYTNQPDYLNYSDTTIVDDMLYGLGLAFNEREYKMAGGYRKFKNRLRKHLGCSKTELGAWLQIEED